MVARAPRRPPLGRRVAPPGALLPTVLADATPKALEQPGKTLEQVFRDLTTKPLEAA